METTHPTTPTSIYNIHPVVYILTYHDGKSESHALGAFTTLEQAKSAATVAHKNHPLEWIPYQTDDHIMHQRGFTAQTTEWYCECTIEIWEIVANTTTITNLSII